MASTHSADSRGSIVSHVVLGLLFEQLPESVRSELFAIVSDVDVARHLAVFRSEYREQIPLRAELSFSNQIEGTLFESGWQAAGCMLLGLAALRSGGFEKGGRAFRMARWIGIAGLVVWGLQILLAQAWMSRFRTGPMEALWRGLYLGNFSLGCRERRKKG